MRIEPYRPEHMKLMQLQPVQRWCAPMLTDEFLMELTEVDGYTAFVDDQPIACAGTMQMWEGRHVAWSFLGVQAGPYLLSLTRAIDRYLTLKNFRRVEAYVDPDFEAGRRWMLRLRFRRVALLEKFLPDGRDQLLYERLENG